MTTTDSSDTTDLKRHVGVIGLLFSSVGSIIGSGWLFGALNASMEAGPAAIISWGLGGILILLIALTYAELGTMFPLSGGVVRYPHLAFGTFASFTSGWITWVAVGPRRRSRWRRRCSTARSTPPSPSPTWSTGKRSTR